MKNLIANTMKKSISSANIRVVKVGMSKVVLTSGAAIRLRATFGSEFVPADDESVFSLLGGGGGILLPVTFSYAFTM